MPHRQKKTSYTRHDVTVVHNVYRVIILVLVAIFLWALNHYGVLDDFIFDVSGGKMVLRPDLSAWMVFWKVTKWLVSVLAVLGGIYTAWHTFFKKEKE